MLIGRRQFAITAACGFAGMAFSQGCSNKKKEEVIDIHQHLNYVNRSDPDFIAHQERMGVTRSVLLPAGSYLNVESTHFGESNGLAAKISVTQSAYELTQEHPDKFVYFCCEVPDTDGAIESMESWLKKGAVGIGEMKFNIDCDSAPMIRVYELANEYQVPVLIHFQHGMYNHGFERFYKILERFPDVNFIGHAQTWWGNIDAKHEQEVMYPAGPVTPGGLTDRYLADYPNMYGDLSAGSGKNALDRDPEHAAAFLERHQDKLCLGTDCPDIEGEGESCKGSGQIANVRTYAHDPEVRAKIFSKNARRIIRIS
ncbi:MAG: amidohydrolase family protein [Verrucomicrobia bacterium]|nr:amidohydrolase family protein [Verrucomicrobiota bacterium]MDA1066237.1 amidohydrolase family protein [Verrucomicrobiota bacterium]